VRSHPFSRSPRARRDRLRSHAERRRLRRDIAEFTTSAEILELRSIVARHDPAETQEIRRLIAALPAS
jgi:hypothetical protein